MKMRKGDDETEKLKMTIIKEKRRKGKGKKKGGKGKKSGKGKKGGKGEKDGEGGMRQARRKTGKSSGPKTHYKNKDVDPDDILDKLRRHRRRRRRHRRRH